MKDLLEAEASALVLLEAEEAAEARRVESERSLILKVLYSLAANGVNGEVGSATLLAEVKVKVAEDQVSSLAEEDEGDLDAILNQFSPTSSTLS